jgi:hypothetical protein
MNVILAVAAIAALGWGIKNRIAMNVGHAALLWYIQEKGLPLPTEKDLEAGTRYAVEHFKKDFSRGMR